MKKRLLLLSLLALALGSTAQTVTVYRAGVATTPVHTTIKDAVSAALADDSLVLSADVFHERMIVINKSLSLKGTISSTGRTIIDAGHYMGMLDSNAIIFINPGYPASTDTLYIKDVDITKGWSRNQYHTADHLAGGGAISADSGTLLILDGATRLYDNRALSTPMWSTPENGAAVYSVGDIIIKGQSQIFNNLAGAAGSVFSTKSVILMEKASCTGNESSLGGAIFSTGTILIQDSAIVEKNRATTGGGIYSAGGKVRIKDHALLRKNNATQGGAIYAQELTISGGCMIDSNIAATYGGGIYVSGTILAADSATIQNNEAGYGGGIYSSGLLTLQDSVTLKHNKAKHGGGVYSDGNFISNNYIRIDSNIAEISGGGIYLTGTGDIRDTSIISNNNALTGAGITVSNGVLALSGRSLVIANKAGLQGAGMSLLNSHFTMSDSSIIGFNTTDTNYAAAIYAKGNNDMYIRGGQIIGNQSTKAGSAGLGMAIYNDSASGGSAIVSVSNARIFNPRADFSRQNELYNLHEVSAFLTDSTWWGESDTTGLFYNHPAALTSYRTWVIADWRVNNDAPVAGLSSFPVEAHFRLSTGAPLAPYMFWMLEGAFSTDYGSFSPTTVPMNTANRIGSTYSIPATSTMVNVQAIVDADTFRKAIWILVLSVTEQQAGNALSVYPNPGNGVMTIRSTGSKPQSVTVLDLYGRVMLSRELIFSGNSSRFELDIPSGQYLLRLNDAEDKVHYEKISIAR